MGDFFKSNRYAVDSLSNLNSNTVLQARTQPKMHGGGGQANFNFQDLDVYILLDSVLI